MATGDPKGLFEGAHKPKEDTKKKKERTKIIYLGGPQRGKAPRAGTYIHTKCIVF
jgi:hypothetical protein